MTILRLLAVLPSLSLKPSRLRGLGPRGSVTAVLSMQIGHGRVEELGLQLAQTAGLVVSVARDQSVDFALEGFVQLLDPRASEPFGGESDRGQLVFQHHRRAA